MHPGARFGGHQHADQRTLVVRIACHHAENVDQTPPGDEWRGAVEHISTVDAAREQAGLVVRTRVAHTGTYPSVSEVLGKSFAQFEVR